MSEEEREIINRELERIEKEENIKILFAVESGSRAWGFESKDSDFDVRFVYIRPLSWYLSVSKRKDTLEFMINKDLAKLCLPMSSNAIVHDWWVGLVASCFGKIGYVDDSTIKYRQHTSNTIGAKGFDIGFVLKSISKKVSLGGNISQSKGFFQQFKNELDEDTIEMIQEFISLEQKTWWQKRAVLLKFKLFKQGFIRNTGLFLKI